jgi:mannose-1-phosphate guanylyltransferase
VRGFIFAAGFGQRLRPITDSMPKPLVPLVNVPSICYALLALKKAGIRQIAANLHYRPEAIARFFRENGDFGTELVFSREEQILGTGGGLKACQHRLGDDELVVLNSDVVMDLELDQVIAQHHQKKSIATVVLYPTEQARTIGPVGIEGDRVVDFKNYLGTGVRSDYIYTGAAVLSPEIFFYLHPDHSSIVYTAYTDLICHRRLDYFVHTGLWRDIGTVDSFRQTNLGLLAQMEKWQGDLEQQLHLAMEPVSALATVAKDAVIINSVIGETCEVARAVTIENSVLLAGAKMTEGRTVKDAVVTSDGRILSDHLE